MVFGRGLCGRWEVGYEIPPERRGTGCGRRLVAARAPAGAGGRAVVGTERAPGNAASMRSTLAAGFVPVGVEMLFGSGAERRTG